MKKTFPVGIAALVFFLISGTAFFSACKTDAGEETVSAQSFTITLIQPPSGSISSGGVARAGAGTNITLTAIPPAGHTVEKFIISGMGGDIEATDTTDPNVKTFTMPSGPVVVRVAFAAGLGQKYAVNLIQPDSGGTISADRAAAEAGTLITLTANPRTDYQFGSFTVIGSLEEIPADETADPNVWTFTMPAGAVTVTAVFIDEGAEFFAVIIDPEPENGTVTTRFEEYAAGMSVNVTITPDTGYKISHAPAPSVTWSGGSVGINHVSGDIWIFIMPEGEVTVSAIFIDAEIPEYRVTIHQSTGGSVSADITLAPAGTEITLTISPVADDGYKFEGTPSVTRGEDGVEEDVEDLTGSGGSWTFTMPGGDVTVTAEFELIVFNVSVDPLDHGGITPDPAAAARGQTITLTVEPDGGWQLSGKPAVTRDGGADVPVSASGDGWVFIMPVGNVTVSAEFIKEHDVNVGVLVNGGITADPAAAVRGTEVSLTAEPDDGFQLKGEPVVTWTGGTVAVEGSGGAWTFTMPDGDVDVTAEFAEEYTVSVDPLDDGTITAAPVKAIAGAAVTLTIRPLRGYQLVDGSLEVTWTGGDITVSGTGNTRTFTMPAGDVAVTAEFEEMPKPPPLLITNFSAGGAVDWVDLSDTNLSVAGGIGAGVGPGGQNAMNMAYGPGTSTAPVKYAELRYSNAINANLSAAGYTQITITTEVTVLEPWYRFILIDSAGNRYGQDYTLPDGPWSDVELPLDEFKLLNGREYDSSGDLFPGGTITAIGLAIPVTVTGNQALRVASVYAE